MGRDGRYDEEKFLGFLSLLFSFLVLSLDFSSTPARVFQIPFRSTSSGNRIREVQLVETAGKRAWRWSTQWIFEQKAEWSYS